MLNVVVSSLMEVRCSLSNCVAHRVFVVTLVLVYKNMICIMNCAVQGYDEPFQV